MAPQNNARRARVGLLVAAGAAAAGALAFAIPTMTADAATSGKVTLCHRTDSETNPYVRITVAPAGAYNGHYTEHKGTVWTKTHPKEPKWGDVIPPFSYRGKTYSLNYGTRGQAIFANGCHVGGPAPSSTPPSSSSTS